jgi:hypothetical protein
MKVLTCPVCRRVKTVPREQETCSMRCSHQLQRQRDPVGYAAKKRRAGLARGVRARDRSIAFWAQRFPEVPRTVAAVIFTAGYQAGDKNGQQRGYQQGLNAASGLRRSA